MSLGGLRRLCLIWLNASDGHERQPYIAHLPEQAMQGGLIDHRANQPCLAIVFPRDGQPIKPAAPPVIKVPLDAKLILPRPVALLFRCCPTLVHWRIPFTIITSASLPAHLP